MKKRKFLWFLPLVCILCACAPTPNMGELLTYQTEIQRMSVRITDGKTVFLAEITRTEDILSLAFTDDEREDIGYRMDKSGTIVMNYGDFEIIMTDGEYLKCRDWFSLLNLSASETIWRIKKETLGGIEVFVCHDGMVTVYIDCETRKPLKIEKGDISIDILAFS